MRGNFPRSLEMLLEHEGGFVHHPRDPGGMTNLGVTKAAWEEHVGHRVDEAVMRRLTPETVAPFYKEKYWDKVKGDYLPAGVDHAVFDFAVNSGVSRASKSLQRVVGLRPDGIIGTRTLDAVGKMDPAEIVARLSSDRLAFLQKLPTWPTFGRGWRRRVASVQLQATHAFA